jgi:hypothetical protein
MRRVALLGLFIALPFVAVPLVWAAANGSGSRDGVCVVSECALRSRAAEGEPSAAPARWDAHARPVAVERLAHNLRHGGVAVQYGPRVPERTVRRLAVWYRRDPVAVVVAPAPELGDRLVISAWSARARCRAFDAAAFSEFRDSQRFRGPESPPNAELRPARAIASLRATSRRIEIGISAPAGVSAEVRDPGGRVVRRLGHFTVPARQRLVLAWDGRDNAGRRLAAGRYLAVVIADGELGHAVVRYGFPVSRGD